MRAICIKKKRGRGEDLARRPLSAAGRSSRMNPDHRVAEMRVILERTLNTRQDRSKIERRCLGYLQSIITNGTRCYPQVLLSLAAR